MCDLEDLWAPFHESEKKILVVARGSKPSSPNPFVSRPKPADESPFAVKLEYFRSAKNWFSKRAPRFEDRYVELVEWFSKFEEPAPTCVFGRDSEIGKCWHSRCAQKKKQHREREEARLKTGFSVYTLDVDIPVCASAGET